MSRDNYQRKSQALAIVLAISYGWFGAHHFYMGKAGLGGLYLIFFWTLIPLFVGVVEGIFFMARQVDRFSEELASDIVMRIKASRK